MMIILPICINEPVRQKYVLISNKQA